MHDIYGQEFVKSTAAYAGIADEAFYREIYNIQRRAGEAFQFNHLSKKTVDGVLKHNWSGEHYSKRIWRNTSGLGKQLKEEMLPGTLSGKTEHEMAQTIMERFAVGSTKARRLIRTESFYVFNEMNARADQEAGFDRYRYLATLDLRTSEICREMDGKEFSYKDRMVGVNYPSLHPWCRSTTIYAWDPAIMATMKRRAWDPEKGEYIKVPGDMTYKEWYEKFVTPESEEKIKTEQRRLSDIIQMKRYQKILGKDAPKTLEEFQELKYNKPDEWRLVKLDAHRRLALVRDPGLRLPNAETATAATAKFEKYLFGGSHKEGLAKGVAFSHRLGYSGRNWEKLRDEILDRAELYPATLKGVNSYEKHLYQQKMILYGITKKLTNVIVGWAVDKKGTKMTSAYIKEAKQSGNQGI